ncbi:hypothetical protein [Mucilaginibacter terrigena]|uniref:hypothetical protein n=1 Tax=Mucilaginibacter terrigena TaxID=2492395 RepID=UPI001396C9EC|nr:hypothetical protein [Mucilaginibacter terrigena]
MRCTIQRLRPSSERGYYPDDYKDDDNYGYNAYGSAGFKNTADNRTSAKGNHCQSD